MLSITYLVMIISTAIVGNYYRKSDNMISHKEYLLTMLSLGLIILFGFIYGLGKHDDALSFIWLITVAHYAINGVVFSLITDIPLKMTYGGWKTRRYK